MPYMQHRKSLRAYDGAFLGSQPLLHWVLLFLVFFLWSFRNFFYVNSDFEWGVVLAMSFTQTFFGGIDVDLASHITENVLFYILILIIVFFSITQVLQASSLFMQLLSIATIITLLVALILNSPTDASKDDLAFNQDRVMAIYLAISTIYIISLLLQRKLMPLMMRTNVLWVRPFIWTRHDLASDADVQRLITLPPGYQAVRPLRAVTIMYTWPWWARNLPFIGRDTISYAGEVDGEGHPCGYGEWQDTAWHGEHLMGFWVDAVPRGPYRSRETGSASGIVNLRVGYVRNRGEALQHAAFIPHLSEVTYGVVCCEVSTSGAWFKSLPILSELVPPVKMVIDEEGDARFAHMPDKLFMSRSVTAAAAERGRNAGSVLASTASCWREEEDAVPAPSTHSSLGDGHVPWFINMLTAMHIEPARETQRNAVETVVAKNGRTLSQEQLSRVPLMSETTCEGDHDDAILRRQQQNAMSAMAAQHRANFSFLKSAASLRAGGVLSDRALQPQPFLPPLLQPSFVSTAYLNDSRRHAPLNAAHDRFARMSLPVVRGSAHGVPEGEDGPSSSSGMVPRMQQMHAASLPSQLVGTHFAVPPPPTEAPQQPSQLPSRGDGGIGGGGGAGGGADESLAASHTAAADGKPPEVSSQHTHQATTLTSQPYDAATPGHAAHPHHGATNTYPHYLSPHLSSHPHHHHHHHAPQRPSFLGAHQHPLPSSSSSAAPAALSHHPVDPLTHSPHTHQQLLSSPQSAGGASPHLPLSSSQSSTVASQPHPLPLHQHLQPPPSATSASTTPPLSHQHLQPPPDPSGTSGVAWPPLSLQLPLQRQPSASGTSDSTRQSLTPQPSGVRDTRPLSSIPCFEKEGTGGVSREGSEGSLLLERPNSSSGSSADSDAPSVPLPLSQRYEALLFVHGLGVDLHKALRHYAQMMALANYPPYIAPIIFSWPSSIPVGYFAARYCAAEKAATGMALADTIRALAADGFTAVHLMVHSMGTRVLANAVPHIEQLKAPGPKHMAMEIASVIILNPDFGLDLFVSDIGPRLRRLCERVTLFGDTSDGALKWSEIVNAIARPYLRYSAWRKRVVVKACSVTQDAAVEIGQHIANAAGTAGQVAHTIGREGGAQIVNAAGAAGSAAGQIMHTIGRDSGLTTADSFTAGRGPSVAVQMTQAADADSDSVGQLPGPMAPTPRTRMGESVRGWTTAATDDQGPPVSTGDKEWSSKVAAPAVAGVPLAAAAVYITREYSHSSASTIAGTEAQPPPSEAAAAGTEAQPPPSEAAAAGTEAQPPPSAVVAAAPAAGDHRAVLPAVLPASLQPHGNTSAATLSPLESEAPSAQSPQQPGGGGMAPATPPPPPAELNVSELPGTSPLPLLRDGLPVAAACPLQTELGSAPLHLLDSPGPLCTAHNTDACTMQQPSQQRPLSQPQQQQPPQQPSQSPHLQQRSVAFADDRSPPAGEWNGSRRSSARSDHSSRRHSAVDPGPPGARDETRAAGNCGPAHPLHHPPPSEQDHHWLGHDGGGGGGVHPLSDPTHFMRHSVNVASLAYDRSHATDHENAYKASRRFSIPLDGGSGSGRRPDPVDVAADPAFILDVIGLDDHDAMSPPSPSKGDVDGTGGQQAGQVLGGLNVLPSFSRIATYLNTHSRRMHGYDVGVGESARAAVVAGAADVFRKVMSMGRAPPAAAGVVAPDVEAPPPFPTPAAQPVAPRLSPPFRHQPSVAVPAAAPKTLRWWQERVFHYRRRLRKPFFYEWLEKSLGRRIYNLHDPKTGAILDIDVIDISYLTANVASNRHTHFALNREIIDDIWEIVILRHRAWQRSSRLEPISTNVFGIVVAPSYLEIRSL